MAFDEPAYELIEASTSGGNINSLVSALRRFPGELDPAEAQRQLFCHMRRALQEDATLIGPFVRTLFRLMIEGDLCFPGAEASIYALDHEWDHVLEGRHGDKAAVRAQLEALLSQFADEP